jgi:hypothetical protein
MNVIKFVEEMKQFEANLELIEFIFPDTVNSIQTKLKSFSNNYNEILRSYNIPPYVNLLEKSSQIYHCIKYIIEVCETVINNLEIKYELPENYEEFIIILSSASNLKDMVKDIGNLYLEVCLFLNITK